MRRYLLTRLALTAPLLLLLLSATFLLLRVAPGDPVTATLGDRASGERVTELRHSLGLDDPLWRQYGRYVSGTLHGDFGRAITTGTPVWKTIKDRFPATLELTLAAMLVAVAVGIAVGAAAARFRDSALDVAGRVLGVVLYAAPIFWLGILFQLLFAVHLHWFPTSGRTAAFAEPRHLTGLYTVDALLTGNLHGLSQALRHLALPAVTLGLVIGGVLVRLVRVNMLQALRSDHVEAARARGLPERSVVLRHALRSALVPVVAVIGLQFALLLSGAVLTEATFNWPGLGLSLYKFLGDRDYTGVQGLVTFYALFVVVVSLLIDIVSAWV
ncbi:MAG TPA: ABC transporter permease, partial [Acidimicrobiia bacterium]|nr:ABC transporter permease [Acidimicrobiia bacterium]